MSKLLDSILNKNLVEANENFLERMEYIKEQKLYEVKRSMNISEIVKPVKGKPGEFEGQNTAADWAAYRKQHPSFGMHDVPSKTGKPKKQKPPEHEKTSSGGLTKKGIEARRKRGYIQAYPASKVKEFLDKLSHYKKTGEITEGEMGLAGLTKQAQAVAKAPLKKGLSPASGAFGVRGKGRFKPKVDVIGRMSQAGKERDKPDYSLSMAAGMTKAGEEAKAAAEKEKREKIDNRKKEIKSKADTIASMINATRG